MKYSDEIITFDIPEKFINGKFKKYYADTWNIECKNTVLNISIPRGLIPRDILLHGIKRQPTHEEIFEELQNIELRAMRQIAPIENISNPIIKKGMYAFNYKITSKERHYYINAILYCNNNNNNIIITVNSIGMTKINETFSIEQLMPTINSITFNVKAYNESVKQFEKKLEKILKKGKKEKYSEPPFLIPFLIPPEFSREKTDHTSGSVLLKKAGMRIQIFDLTNLGHEADIDIFEKNLKKGEKIEDACLWKLRGKKCLIQNLESTPLDISSCKNISILLAFRGKCYSVLMKSDNPFDLNEYNTFLDSIGIKTKKHRIIKNNADGYYK
jgi:hypothetical protein